MVSLSHTLIYTNITKKYISSYGALRKTERIKEKANERDLSDEALTPDTIDQTLVAIVTVQHHPQ